MFIFGNSANQLNNSGGSSVKIPFFIIEKANIYMKFVIKTWRHYDV